MIAALADAVTVALLWAFAGVFFVALLVLGIVAAGWCVVDADAARGAWPT